VRRAGTTLVERISFTLAPGEIAAVIGANGAGKTTLLEAVVGRRHPAAGRVTYAGVPLEDLESRAQVFSFMPDAGEPAAELRVEKLIGFAGRYGRVEPDVTKSLARRLGLAALSSARFRGRARR
jgi:ABC-type multidrug transport system ATPase subunit